EMGAEGATGGPRLLAGEAPALGYVVATRRRLDPGQVAPRVGLRPPLAPEIFRSGHARQDAILLLLGAELEHGRREEEDAVLGDPLRPARPVVLLLEDQPLDETR